LNPDPRVGNKPKRVKLLAIASENGLGHVRRVVGMLSGLCERVPALEVHLACEAWQLERLRGWARLERLRAHGLHTHTGVVADSLRWPLPDDRPERLWGWEQRLRALAPTSEADLVLSDNLVGALDVRADTVLAGSFLWSDVLDDTPGAGELIRRDRALLARHRPPMLCVEALAMPGVRERTNAVPLPWMCDRVVERVPEARRVAVLGGASGAADALLREAARALAQAGFDVTAPGAWAVGEPFGHEAEDFARCALVVCRPGAGTLTDAVAASVPTLLVYERPGREMAHNAARMAELGLGVDLGDVDADAVVAAARRLFDGMALDAMRTRLRVQAKDGLERAAAWLAARLGGGARA
jgi:Glycosyltransferase family 28 C-terminal domain